MDAGYKKTESTILICCILKELGRLHVYHWVTSARLQTTISEYLRRQDTHLKVEFCPISVV